MSDEADFYKEIIDQLYDGIYFVDRDRVITYWNKGAERITGYSSAQTLGRACRDNLLNHVTEDGVQLCHNGCPLAAVMEDGNPRESEVFVHHADGHRLPVVVRATALRDRAGNIIGAIESFSNNSSVINARRRLSEMSQIVYTDALTRVGNRQHMEGRLHALIAEFKNTQKLAGLLFIDIDRFKKVNDTYGHDVGDKALCMVANTICHGLRSTDTIGRWGGEEFVAILYDVFDEKTLLKIAEKIRMLVQVSHLETNTQSLSVTISIGATRLYANDTPESILQRADGLMYRSKQAGRNRVTLG
jgi:diguanylate cyclase (GGDEF)-like protein/PAS domain S-box-containing protein